ncbi:unnamed protein product [Durusdinium trenchii]|uniref:SPX domain-containing protein n=1 Tax=Durusdinium trenchii TaxID=1381693 RepID=A0ABP0MFF4_9DINO
MLTVLQEDVNRRKLSQLCAPSEADLQSKLKEMKKVETKEDHALDTKMLENLEKVFANCGGNEQSRLRELLRQQLLKISGYAELQAQTIGGEIRYMLQRPNHICKDRIKVLVEDYIELFRFWNLNQEGFRKICKKMDKKCQDGFSKWFLPMVETCDFRSKDWDLSLLFLGQVHDSVSREHLEGEVLYQVILIPAEEVMIAKVILGTMCLAPPDPRPEGSRMRWFAELPRKVKPLTNLVWFDSAELPQFLQRYRQRNCDLLMAGCAVSDFRFRWVEGAAEEVFLDIVYQNREKSSSRMKHSEVAALCRKQEPSGRSDPGVEEIQALIERDGLSPMVSCSFRRTTFHSARHGAQVLTWSDSRDLHGKEDSALAVLDEDIVFIDEWREKKQWCRILEEAESPKQEGRASLGWALLRLRRGVPVAVAQRLRELGMAQAHYFSKALCGTLIFQQAALRRLPIHLPDFSMQTVFRLSTAGFPLPVGGELVEPFDDSGGRSPASSGIFQAEQGLTSWAACRALRFQVSPFTEQRHGER